MRDQIGEVFGGFKEGIQKEKTKIYVAFQQKLSGKLIFLFFFAVLISGAQRGSGQAFPESESVGIATKMGNLRGRF